MSLNFNAYGSLNARIISAGDMSLDNILYDLNRIASEAHDPIPFEGLDVWVLGVRAVAIYDAAVD